ncbi:isochorismatase family protein [Renibacterium salmoninarum ATCC 33209]|uniref:Isochorismatase family protein n=1 Tax=Renibacterium salmoninarum (strain ATCC 33209 / DSM 20767 / JCM 11484 / NBRC 15589 / NCIMB 2235) TaxID=288705 RepID=A9WMF3_RENSM|nr:isochorismatase family protein [Renibacterium salmoninarum]ABY23466.1 isochorismatase family protein [Renibacterium salmoninarum ATCC 33209]
MRSRIWSTAISKAVEAGALIVFVRDRDVAGGEGPGFEVHESLRQPAGSVTIDKSNNSAFTRTVLGPFLVERGMPHVAICGMQSEYCVDTAVRAAVGRDLDVTLLQDAHTTVDSPVLSADQIIAHTNETLYPHGDLENFCVTRSVSEDIFVPNHAETLQSWHDAEG